ncbi:hypothetical protein CWN98_17235 [Vibrio splendidus]|uniref:hypothetical protein n=1 Tax=Vibrio splendidus TaxID=29497 RepID=UPI000D344A8C|nr:hypothetical protein [Vibrio splendidus]PTO84335.1 hypothetical protein CWN98_17235 [Vibrio splendidus]PTP45354.1 hypothetical protein CWO10_16950 [Vibrio splendidus]
MDLLHNDWFSTGAAIAIIVGLLPFLRFFHELVSSHKQFKVKNLELLIHSFDNAANPAMKLVVEQQFRLLFKYEANYDEICILLSSQKPTNAIELYKDGSPYLMYDEGKFRFKEKYADEKKQLCEYFVRPVKNFTLYMAYALPAAFLGVGTLFLAMTTNLLELTIGLPNAGWYLMLFALAGMFMRMAYHKVTNTHSIKYADELLFNYEINHVKNVELTLRDNVKNVLTNDVTRRIFLS